MANGTMFNGRTVLRITKSGTIDKRNKIGALIQTLVDQKVDEALENAGVGGQTKKPIILQYFTKV